MQNTIGWLLNRASYGWRTVVDKAMKELGLTQSGWMTMLHLHRLGEGCSQKALAANIGIEQPTLQRSVNCLQESGYLLRKTSAGDARVKTLWFTEQGRALLARMEAIAADCRAEMLAGLSDQECEQFSQLLEKVLDNANTKLRRTHDN